MRGREGGKEGRRGAILTHDPVGLYTHTGYIYIKLHGKLLAGSHTHRGSLSPPAKRLWTQWTRSANVTNTT